MALLHSVALYLHIAGAIIAFGPTFVFPLIGPTLRNHPRSIHFAVVLMETIEQRLILPAAGSMLVSGLLLVFSLKYNILGTPWLIGGILFYLGAMGLATGRQLPTTRKLLALVEQAPADAPAGPPPPAAQALIDQLRVGGMVLTGFLAIIVFLMVFKPGPSAFIH